MHVFLTTIDRIKILDRYSSRMPNYFQNIVHHGPGFLSDHRLSIRQKFSKLLRDVFSATTTTMNYNFFNFFSNALSQSGML